MSSGFVVFYSTGLVIFYPSIMPLRKVQLVNGEFYHIVKRGTDKRKIFLDDEDRLRFINSLLVFNDQNPVPWESRGFWHQRGPSSLVTSVYKVENPLVEIHVFTLMENHFHLLVRQIVEHGITTYMRKLGGYSYYFNQKHKRMGSLFEGRYKIKLIETDAQLKNNFVYIHTNPVEIIEQRWKDEIVKSPQKAIEFLEKEYRWSSYWDYLGKQNFPSLTNRNFFLEVFGGAQEIKKQIDAWVLFKASNNENGDSKDVTNEARPRW